jgi:hypothetical protein
MNHIKIFEEFSPVNEGAVTPVKAITKEIDMRVDQNNTFPSNPKLLKSNSGYYYVYGNLSGKQLNPSILSANIEFMITPEGGCYSQIRMNTIIYRKDVTAQEVAKATNPENPNEIVAQFFRFWQGLFNKVDKSELIKDLKEEGWKEAKNF